MEYLSSLYIDNELDLVEKLHFIERIRSDDDLFFETLVLLEQEKLLKKNSARLRGLVTERERQNPGKRLIKFLKPFSYAGLGAALATFLFFIIVFPAPEKVPAQQRFVLFEPSADRVEITGTFSNWRRLDMVRLGTTGYWELNIQIPDGEHRFAYILDGSKQMADPTRPAREKDDFGGENSILQVKVGA